MYNKLTGPQSTSKETSHDKSLTPQKHGVWTKRISTPSIMELHLANVEGKNVHLDKPIRHEGNWNLGMAHLHRTLHTLVRGLISNPFNLSHRHIFSRGDPLSFRQSTWAIFTIVFYY